MRRLGLVLFLALLAMPGAGQAERDETLADIRQELSVLYVELQKLKRELSTTTGPAMPESGGSLPERVNAIEGELQRLTAKTEELEHRIGRVARDGANRLGDLEFRLCELEAGCDIATLEQGTTLGGVETGDAAATPPPDDTADGPQMAVGERAAFEAADAAMAGGNYAEAAAAFARFQQTYPDGPLSDQAALKRGEALEGAGKRTQAARAYLDLFSTAPAGPLAADALYRLGRTLGELDQIDEACVTLSEVKLRFPVSPVVAEAAAARQDLGCQ